MTSVHIPPNSARIGIRGTLTVVEPMVGREAKTDNSAGFTIESDARERLSSLSCREREVLNRIVSGCTNKATSIRLGISIKTVEKHRGKLMKKLGVLHIPDLMRLWLQAHPEELTMIRYSKS